MATQIFMELEGIDGGTEDPNFEGYFDVVSFDMGGAYNFNPATFSASGSAVANPVTVVFKHDKMLATIYDYWIKRTKTNAKIVWRQFEEEEATNAIELTLTDTFIVAVNSSVTDSEGTEVEAINSVTLTYKTFNVVTASASGGAGGEMEFNVGG
ncbi:MAG: type VI secretion system tube protein Hcp [Pseudomonadota bacterium]